MVIFYTHCIHHYLSTNAGALISFFVAVVAAAAPGFIPPGFLALALVYSFQLTTYLKFCADMPG
jgi:hypothetical protein